MKIEPLNIDSLDGIDEKFALSYNMHTHIQEKLYNNLQSQVEKAFIEGLRLKGHEFRHPYELEQFIKNHVTCKDYIESNERIYSIDDKPFFYHNYAVKMDPFPKEEDNKLTMSANYGYYRYL